MCSTPPVTNGPCLSSGTGPAIIKFRKKPWDSYLRERVYSDITRSHKDLGLLAKRYGADADTKSMSKGKRHYHDMRCKILAISDTWTAAVQRMAGSGCIPAGVLQSMMSCRPEGVVFSTSVPNVTCRKHAVCPWCSYRRGMEILADLEVHLAPGRRIARLTVYELVSTPDDDRQLRIVKKLIRNLCKDRRQRIADWVVYRPYYDPAAKRWMIATSIVAIGEGGAPFIDPEQVVARMKEREWPALFGAGWEIRRAFKKHLADAVGQAIRVPLGDLVDTDHEMLVSFVNLGRRHRSEGHGGRGGARI